jgi:magnesium-transporting ATPase (P-type)
VKPDLLEATFFLFSAGAAEIPMVLTGLVLGWSLALLPTQLLWLNLVTNGLQDMALASEPGDPGVLGVHHVPKGRGWCRGRLRVQPLSLRPWVAGALIAMSALAAVEIDKALGRTRR